MTLQPNYSDVAPCTYSLRVITLRAELPQNAEVYI